MENFLSLYSKTWFKLLMLGVEALGVSATLYILACRFNAPTADYQESVRTILRWLSAAAASVSLTTFGISLFLVGKRDRDTRLKLVPARVASGIDCEAPTPSLQFFQR